MKNLSKRIATIAATLALVVVLGVTLAACGQSGYKALTADEYNANLTYAGYGAAIITPESDDWTDTIGSLKKSFNENLKDIEAYNALNNAQWVIRSGKYVGNEYRYLYITGFSDNASAKAVYKAYKASMQNAIDNATTATEEAEYKQYKVVLAGNVAMYATTQSEIDAAYRKN